MRWPRFFGPRDECPEARGAGDPRSERLGRRRRRMLETDLAGRGVADPRVLEAMARVPRERFVPERFFGSAYDDCPHDIGFGQTISQPYIVARMSELVRLAPGDKVLEIGAGSGYQTAVLIELGAFVYAIEIIPELARAHRSRLGALGYDRFEIDCRDGRLGWPEHAPYDAILIAAAADRLAPELLDQVRPGGCIVAPIGEGSAQKLVRWILGPEGWTEERLIPVRFVPLVGSHDSD